MPYEESELIYKLQLAKDKAFHLFRDIEQKDTTNEEYVKEEFEMFYQDDIAFTLDSNTSASEAYNFSLIDKLFRDIVNKLNEGSYQDNFNAFERDWINGMKEYERLARGPGKLVAIADFSRKNQHTCFSKFYQTTTENYENEIKELRTKQKIYRNELIEKINTPKEDIVNAHVISRLDF